MLKSKIAVGRYSVAHREAVVPVRVSGATIEERALRDTVMFVVLYLLVFAVGAMALQLDAMRVGGELGAFEALGAAAADWATSAPRPDRRPLRLLTLGSAASPPSS